MLSWLRAKPLADDADCSRDIARMNRHSSIRGITCTGKTDGGGAQVHAVMSAILFADAIGVPYFHTPFRSVEHSDNPEAFAARWESAFNLGKNCDPPPDDAPIVTGKAIVEGYSGRPAILRQEYFQDLAT